MSSPKRHVFISLLFVLKCFTKSFVIKNTSHFLSKRDETLVNFQSSGISANRISNNRAPAIDIITPILIISVFQS